MTPRSLVPGLIAEGEAAESFLGIVISRQLRELTWMSPHVVDVEATEIVTCGRDRVVAAMQELAADCHLLFTHNVEWERGKIGGRADGVRYHSHYLVPVVSLGDTDAWLLADPAVWAKLEGSDLSRLPARPRDVARIADPGEVLAATVPPAGQAPARLLPVHRTEHRSRRAGPGARLRGLGGRDAERTKRTWLPVSNNARNERGVVSDQ
ncbi:hypothetical protein GCM10018953_23220 [Streptosporangium nondiastaticum]|uniref:hypothetical protein n=1 Tax=Streptosporangium nondiastaticum TaxID=35764 RepID=UPI0031F76D29